jgi:thymidine kinase
MVAGTSQKGDRMTGESGKHAGRIEVIVGCMFSGKTGMLIARIREAVAAGRRVCVFKHAADKRYTAGDLVSHNGARYPAVALSEAAQLADHADDADLIAVDEAQFFDDELPDVCRRLAEAGRDVLVVGLDLDSWGLPFGVMPRLEAVADQLTTLQSKCAVCGSPANHTQRLTPVEQSMVGGTADYEPRCAACFVAPPVDLRR